MVRDDTGYLSQQVNSIIEQLHVLFDEIGVSDQERESRETQLFTALSETLRNQVRSVRSEKEDLINEAQHIITTIRQMEASLDDAAPSSRGRRRKRNHAYGNGEEDDEASCDDDEQSEDEDDLQVTYPLVACVESLQQRHRTVSRLHRERYEQVKKLAQALESYSSHLEPTFVRIPLPPTGPNQSIPTNFDLSSTYVDKLDQEFTRVYEEYTQRISTVQSIAEHMIQLWAELGVPQAETDAAVIKYYRDAPEQLGLHQEDVARLESQYNALVEEKNAREKRLHDLRAAVEALWAKLGVEETESKTFLNQNRGFGIRQIQEFEQELARLNELKRQNLHVFVEDARCRLQELWDSLYFSEDEMLEFTPAFSDVYSDALLEAHERELARLEELKEVRAPILQLVQKHMDLVNQQRDLQASSQDASRLMLRGQKGEKRDPGKLLREEKMRKRITKDLPKVIGELRRQLETWEEEYGETFLVHGEPYLDRLDTESTNSKKTTKPTAAAAAAAAATRAKATTTNTNSTGNSHTNGHLMPPSSPKKPVKASTVRGGISLGRAGGATALAAAFTPSEPSGRALPKTPTAAAAAAAPTIATTRNTAATAIPSSTTVPHSVTTTTQSSKSTSYHNKAATIHGSPTRVPTRAPLSNLRHANASPERSRPISSTSATTTAAAATDPSRTQRQMGPPISRAPPPKIREEAPTQPPQYQFHSQPQQQQSQRYTEANTSRPYSVSSSSRSIDDDDIFDGRSQSNSTSISQSSWGDSRHMQFSFERPTSAYSHEGHDIVRANSKQPQAPQLRQVASQQSLVVSENWEAYDDDNSEPEPDASETYYAKVRATRNKRYFGDLPTSTSATSLPNATKRIRAVPDDEVDEDGHVHHENGVADHNDGDYHMDQDVDVDVDMDVNDQQQHHHHHHHHRQPSSAKQYRPTRQHRPTHSMYHPHAKTSQQKQMSQSTHVRAMSRHRPQAKSSTKDIHHHYSKSETADRVRVTVDAEGNRIVSGDWSEEDAF